MATQVMAPVVAFEDAKVEPDKAQHQRRAGIMAQMDAAGLDGLRASDTAVKLWEATKATAARVLAIRRNQQLSEKGQHEKIAAAYTELHETMETLGENFNRDVDSVLSRVHRVLDATLDSEGHTDVDRHASLIAVLQWPNRAPMDAVAHLNQLTAARSVASLRAILPLALKDVDFTRRFQGHPNAPLREAILAAQDAAVTDFELGRGYVDEVIEKMRVALRTYVGMLADYRSDELVNPRTSASIQMLLSVFSGP